MADEKREKNIDRLSLAEKLDNDLEEHMEKLLKKNYKYESDLTMENFDEKIKEMPAFSNTAPTQEDIDASPALQALQAMKYEDENPEACALAHKEDGNYHFQKKDYRKAIIAYTEGLKQKHDDSNLMAVLYTNRAASNSHLGNNRSALNDATSALKHKPGHMKAIIRGTTTCFDLEKYEECISWCEKGLAVNPEETKLIGYKKKAALQKKQNDRDRRKKEMKQFKDLKQRSDLMQALQSRSISVDGVVEDESTESKVERFLYDRSPRSGKVYLDDQQQLHWPLHLLYPEYNQSDFISDMNEDHRLLDHLEIVFSEPTEWDEENVYTIKTIEIFFEDRKRSLLVRVDPKMTLKKLLSDNRYTIKGECPVLMILSKVTDFYTKTFENQNYEEF